MAYNYDSELAGFINWLPTIDLSDPKAAREAVATMIATMNQAVDVSSLMVADRKIPGPEGAPQVPIRIYTPRIPANFPLPALLQIHGGGFVVGSIDTEHALSAMLAQQLEIVVVSVDYRLAPENPFPAGLEDCYAALQWLRNHASELNVNSSRIGVLGQSAGGGLAAALALLARDRGGPDLCFQFLGMPELDDRMTTTSMQAFTDTPMWNAPSARLSWKHYLGEGSKPGGSNVSPYAAPSRATNLAGLPPTYLYAMEFDPLRDENILYALRLLEAGVPVELHTYPGTFHGSTLIETAAISQRIKAEILDVLRQGLHR